MEALARIGMLVERRAVETGQPVLVGREMRRHPVEDDADAGRWAPSTKRAKPCRIAEAGGRRDRGRSVW